MKHVPIVPSHLFHQLEIPRALVISTFRVRTDKDNVSSRLIAPGIPRNKKLKTDASKLYPKYHNFTWAMDVQLEKLSICEMGLKSIFLRMDRLSVKGSRKLQVSLSLARRALALDQSWMEKPTLLRQKYTMARKGIFTLQPGYPALLAARYNCWTTLSMLNTIHDPGFDGLPLRCLVKLRDSLHSSQQF